MEQFCPYTYRQLSWSVDWYFRDEALRRRIFIGLNKGEALHALARQLFFGRLGELRDRALEDQIHWASCWHLLIAAIAAWNTGRQLKRSADRWVMGS